MSICVKVLLNTLNNLDMLFIFCIFVQDLKLEIMNRKIIDENHLNLPQDKVELLQKYLNLRDFIDLEIEEILKNCDVTISRNGTIEKKNNYDI